MTRLADEAETQLAFALARGERRPGSWLTRLALRYLSVRRVGQGAMLLLAHEGRSAEVRAVVRAARSIAGDHGGVYLGGTPVRAWQRSRYRHPYLRDCLLDRGLLVDTLETVVAWDRLTLTRDAAAEAVQGELRPQPALIGAHVSHIYPAGAALYLTVVAPRDPADPLDQWRRMKAAATDAIVRHGGATSHHHAIGLDHRRWRPAGPFDGTQIMARALDPNGILNPGKLLAERHDQG
jgi:alkyldihydroxyacetonephosphate synthase